MYFIFFLSLGKVSAHWLVFKVANKIQRMLRIIDFIGANLDNFASLRQCLRTLWPIES